MIWGLTYYSVNCIITDFTQNGEINHAYRTPKHIATAPYSRDGNMYQSLGLPSGAPSTNFGIEVQSLHSWFCTAAASVTDRPNYHTCFTR
jgi:hypothetical protein